MSWIVDSSLNCIQRFCLNVVKSGNVPKHIAFIMDGNRRFATKKNVKKVVGHERGFDKLAETLQWCYELGVTEVTVYAFSIENFKRTDDEVQGLLNLSREKYKRLLEEKDKLMENGVCIRVIGNLSLLPKDIQQMIAQAMLMTRNNSKLFLNIAFAYTSRDEIANGILTIVNGLQKEHILENDVDEDLLSSCLYSNTDPDMLIRTSGEVRFSDFLLWQIKNSYICFEEVLWPEFNIWNLLACVLKYQLHYQKKDHFNKQKYLNECNNSRKTIFLKHVEQERWKMLEECAKS